MFFVSCAPSAPQLPPGHRGPAEVIYNGVEDVAADPDQQPYPPEMRQELGIPADALVLAYVAEFIIWKDHATAIRTMHELVRRNVNAHLLLIGTGCDIEAHLWQGRPGRRPHPFLGVRTDVRRLLGFVGIHISRSRQEGFGLAVAEAMLASRPVIAARDSGGVVELIEIGSNRPARQSRIGDRHGRCRDGPRRRSAAMPANGARGEGILSGKVRPPPICRCRLFISPGFLSSGIQTAAPIKETQAVCAS